MRFCFALLLTILLPTILFGQQDALADKSALFNDKINPAKLFVHFDKNIYSNNETIWFTAYLLKQGVAKFHQHHIVSVSLIREIDSAVIMEDKFTLSNGIGFGSISLPDSILAGNYHLLAFTDVLLNGKPEAIFQQAITLKTNFDPPFKAEVKILSEINEKKENKVLVSVTSKDNRFLPKPVKIEYKYGNVTKSARTDASGQLLINLPKYIQLKDPSLYIKLIYGRDSSFINTDIPQDKGKAIVKFYPEGGHIITNLPSTVGFEVKDQQAQPLALHALLYKNNEVIDTVETSSYGIGKFTLYPENGFSYHLKLIHSNLLDTIYELPKSLASGISISVANAITNDTLSVIVHNSKKQNLAIKVHNLNRLFLDQSLAFKSGTTKLNLVLEEVPKGLTKITICDSLDRPLAERLVHSGYENLDKLELATNKTSFGQREKVSLKIKAKEHDSFISIACVQDNRIATSKFTDIESYAYVNSELTELPLHNSASSYKDIDYLNQVLLIKGWTKYNWQTSLTTDSQKTITKLDSLKIRAIVTKSKKSLTEPLEVGAYGDRMLRLSSTSNQGILDLNTPEFIAEAGRKMYLFINSKNRLSYAFKVEDEFKKMSKSLSKQLGVERPIVLSNLSNNAELVIKSNEKITRLREVVISKKNDDGMNFSGRLAGSNACGDYVCRYNILNCPNHVGDFENTQPVPGRTYSTNGNNRVYMECKIYSTVNEGYSTFNGVRYSKEYHVSDYKDPLEPAFVSTIYWNQGVLIKAGQETTLEFCTSDITGKFRIIAQGITENDVTFNQSTFQVLPKQKTAN